jgi:hypothetical protein
MSQGVELSIMCSFQQKSQGYQGVMVNEMGLIVNHFDPVGDAIWYKAWC